MSAPKPTDWYHFRYNLIWWDNPFNQADPFSVPEQWWGPAHQRQFPGILDKQSLHHESQAL